MRLLFFNPTSGNKQSGRESRQMGDSSPEKTLKMQAHKASSGSCRRCAAGGWAPCSAPSSHVAEAVWQRQAQNYFAFTLHTSPMQL